MTISYLIAKYVDDLSRNEPRNVGVIAYDGERIAARFDGENDYGQIDLRRVRNRITGSHSYRQWVHYWRHALNDPSALDDELAQVAPGDPAVIERLLDVPTRDFYLEKAGKITLDADERGLDDTVAELFRKLVREPDPPAPMSLREKSRRALATAGAPLDDEARFRVDHEISLQVDGVLVKDEVSYAVQNGEWHYLQEMPFDPGKPRVSRKEASHCAFVFEHAGWTEDQALILYDGSDVGNSYSLLELLRRFAPTVDVNREEVAAEALHDRLKLT